MSVDEEILREIKIEDFTPSKIAGHLKLVPELFMFLKSKESILGRARGLVTFLTSVTIWAFKEKFNKPVREIPEGMLEKLWESFKDKDNENIFDVPYRVEPSLWKYFLSLIYLEAQRDGWEKHELLRAATVYGPILIGCCWMFYPENELLNMEKVWREQS